MTEAEGQIDPQIILNAFTAAEILVSMSDGPPRERDSFGEVYRVMWGNDGLDRFLDDLVSQAEGQESILIEWRVWPERLKNGRIYSRFTIHDKSKITIQ